MTAKHDQDQDQAATDQAAAEATALVAASFAAELAGRPLTAQQRNLQTKAERLARYLSRQAAKEGRP
jgi:hypothetical protein